MGVSLLVLVMLTLSPRLTTMALVVELLQTVLLQKTNIGLTEGTEGKKKGEPPTTDITKVFAPRNVPLLEVSGARKI
ncbi:MAG: hypothetical protein CM15mP3_05670 [Candidatus Poseidoniales archaeon]|nr:MAG: hypothetical protein CM15mP3_05670 [Candidatus Poseidoniales archaeon]